MFYTLKCVFDFEDFILALLVFRLGDSSPCSLPVEKKM